MFKIGQVVETKRGMGVISSIGDSTPYVYIRLDSGPDEVYVMDPSDLISGDALGTGHRGASRWNRASSSGERGQSAAASDKSKQEIAIRRVSRRATKRRNSPAPTAIARFVNGRLEELGMKQCDFCRKTGFDQGLLSRIQSSTSSNLSLESCLRLAIGCSVAPEKIFELVGRPDFHSLILKSYSNAAEGAVAGQATIQ